MDTTVISRRQKLFFVIFLGILVLGGIYFFPTIKKDIALMESVNLTWLLLACCMQLVTYLVSAIIYDRFLRMLYNRPPAIRVWELFQASIVVLFANQIIPSAGISGNSFFLRFLVRRKIDSREAIWLITIELLSFYFTMECIILVTILSEMLQHRIPGAWYLILAAGLLIYGFFAFLIWHLSKKQTIDKVFTWLRKRRVFPKYVARLQTRFEHSPLTITQQPLPFLVQHKVSLFLVTCFQLAIFLADGLSIYALFHGLGLQLSITTVLTGLLLTKIVSLLPVSPGALLIYESSMAFFFMKLGAPLGISILVTLLYRVFSFWLPIPLGFFLSRKLEKT